MGERGRSKSSSTSTTPRNSPSSPRSTRTGAQHKLQFHHIFPKNILKASYTGREADDIANLCFISGKTNRQISDKAPAQYFPPMIKKSGLAAFEAQCIPTDPELLGVEDYKAFLKERRTQIADRLNEFLGT